MNTDTALFLLTGTLMEAAILVAPMLLVCLIVGLIVSIFQVVTSIQEMTLTFVPKLAAIALTFVLIGRWVLLKLVDFTSTKLISLALY